MEQIYKAKWILPGNQKVIKNGFLVINNGKIIDLLIEYHDDNNIIDLGNSVITPGFINMHTHLQFTDLEKDQCSNQKSFPEWLISLMKKYSLLDKEQKITSVKNGIKECILSGTTCITQISNYDFLDIFNDLDIKTYLFLEVFSKDEQTSLDVFESLLSKFNYIYENKSNSVYLGISPHSIYNVHHSLWKKISNFSSINNILVHTHLAESIEEIKWLKYGYSNIDLVHKFVGWDKISPCLTGINPVQYLKKLDILQELKENLILAHMNELAEESMNELIENNVNIVHCPRSNVFLHGKTLKYEILNNKYLSKKIAIGTDSKYSNNDLNILNEAKFVRSCNNLDILKLLDMITINPANILRISDITGSLEKRKDADFLVFKLDEKESYADFIYKTNPNHVYSKGKQLVRDFMFV